MDVVADGLFAEHMQAGLETLHGRLVVVPTVLRAGRTNRYGLQLVAHIRQHLFNAVPALHAVACRKTVGTSGIYIAVAQQLGIGVTHVNLSMPRPNASGPNNGHFQCHNIAPYMLIPYLLELYTV